MVVRQKLIKQSIFLIPLFMLLSACEQMVVKDESLKNEKILSSYAVAMKAYQNKDWPKAQKIFTHITKTDPSNSEAWFKLGNIYARENMSKEAIKHYEEAALRAPKNAKIWHNLAVVQLRQATLSFLRVVENIDSGDPLSIRATKIIDLYDRVQNIIDLNKINTSPKN